MRVRPIFWCILALACISVLTFASTLRTHTPVLMQVHIAQTLVTASGYEARIELHLSDSQGMPIDQAQVAPDAHMTTMAMNARNIQVLQEGNGNYSVLIPFNMAGPWAVHIAATADGFDIQQQNLLLQVV
jgi:hypothetical protein